MLHPERSVVAFQWIEPEGELYERERDLRWRVLRSPLGMPRGSEEMPFELRSRHAVGVDERSSVVACAMLTRPGEEEGDPFARIAQVAVEPGLQRGGVGASLVLWMERQAAMLGMPGIMAHVRVVAAEFWRKQGYHPEGPEFFEVGIPHYRVRKPLASFPESAR